MHIKATWQPHKEEDTSVKFSKSFNDLNKIEKLDFLQDVIAELHSKYELILAVEEIR
jgi:hypothetical protein